MPTTEDKLVQYLIEARAMEQALVRTLQAHIAMTPSGAYRTLLERHLRETRGHAERISRRLADLGRSPSIAETVYDVGQRLTGQLLSLGKAPLDMLRGGSGEEKLLKNAKDEAATEALEIATYDAIEALARAAGDTMTASLAADHRADEERMLAALREQLPALTGAVVASEVAGRPSRAADDSGGTDAAAPPFADYDELNVEQVTRRLDALTPARLEAVVAYERGHKRRRGVLEAVERQQNAARERELAGSGVT